MHPPRLDNKDMIRPQLSGRSGRHIDAKLLQHAIVDIPDGYSTISLNVVHDATCGVWGQAGFMKD